MLLDPSDDGSRNISVVLLGKPFQDRQRYFGPLQRYLGLFSVLAPQSENRLLSSLTGIAEQALVDIADLLHINVPEGKAPGLLALEAGGLERAQHVEHDPVGDGEQ